MINETRRNFFGILEIAKAQQLRENSENSQNFSVFPEKKNSNQILADEKTLEKEQKFAASIKTR
jgi:hypothetical protein